MEEWNWGAVKPQTIWAEPDDDGNTVYQAIINARSTVAISIYELGGPAIMDALRQAKKKGVDIRIMFNGQFFAGSDPNNSRYNQVYANIDELTAAPGRGSLAFHWSSNNYSITHQKTIIIDAFKENKPLAAGSLPENAKALVMTLNLCSYAWVITQDNNRFPVAWEFWGPQNPDIEVKIRDFGVVLTDPALVARIAAVFESDFTCATTGVIQNLKNSRDGLVWSNGTTGIPPAGADSYPAYGIYPPYRPKELDGAVDQGNARSVHLDIIQRAGHTLDIYNEEMNDDQIVQAIIDAAGRGVTVRVLMTGGLQKKNGTDEYYYQFNRNFKKLAQAGVRIRLFPGGPQFLYIHAKVFLADAGRSGAMAYMGSQNISGNSLDFNRELGVVLRGENDTRLIHQVFETDWETQELIKWPGGGQSPALYRTPDQLPSFHQEPFETQPMPCGPIAPRTK